MAIYHVTGLNLFPNPNISLLKNNFAPNTTLQQKKIVLVASLAFGLIALCIATYIHWKTKNAKAFNEMKGNLEKLKAEVAANKAELLINKNLLEGKEFRDKAKTCSMFELKHHLRTVEIKHLPALLQGAAEWDHATDNKIQFRKAFGSLLEDAIFEKKYERFQAALDCSHDTIRDVFKHENLKVVFDKLNFRTVYYSNDKMKLELLIKNKDLFTIPQDILDEAESLLLRYKEIDNKTIHLPYP